MECLWSTDASTEERGGEGTKVGRDAVGSCHHSSKPDSSIGEKKALVLKKCLLKKSSVAQLTEHDKKIVSNEARCRLEEKETCKKPVWICRVNINIGWKN